MACCMALVFDYSGAVTVRAFEGLDSEPDS